MSKIIFYKARDSSGNLVEGEFKDVSDKNIIISKLREKGLVHIEIREKYSAPSWRKLLQVNITAQKVEPKDLPLFCRQMYTMIKAGIPITNALKRLAESTKNTTLSAVLFDTFDKVASGQSLADAISQHPKHFPLIIRHILTVGEKTGRLENAFAQLSSYIGLEIETRKRLGKVIRYPLVVVSAIGIAIVVVNIFVVPAFSRLFRSFETELPIFTRALIGFSDFMLAQWWLLLLALVLLVFAFKRFTSTPYGLLWYNKAQLSIPAIGPILQKILLASFSKTLVMILKTGVPLNEGLDMVGNAVGNEYYKLQIRRIRENMESGGTLTSRAKITNIFPSIALQMMIVREDTGEIDNMMDEIGSYYEREVDYEIDKLGDVIEPFLLIVIGTMFLFLALGVFLPIWELGAAAQT